jgi:hypothetical protein
MRVPTVQTAQRLLGSRFEDMAELWIRGFADDFEAHDDGLQEQLERDFNFAFNEAVSELTSEFGPPRRSGQEFDGSIPIGGLFQYAIWQIRDSELWVAAAHEDRECPFVLLMGCKYHQEDGGN